MRTEDQTQVLTAQPAGAVICEETARICVARYGRALRAVVLTGSLARNEATVIEEGAERRLLGDADFFLVFHNAARQPAAAALETARLEVESLLREKSIYVNVGLQAVDGSYLQGRPRHIEAFELRCRGRVIWGDREVLSLLPDFPADQILLEDAWRLLANRIVELLKVLATTGEPFEMVSEDIFYRTIKLYLDMAASYLVFAGQYRPSYRERDQALQDLVNETSAQAASPFPLRPFAERVSECTRFKLEGQAIAATQADFLNAAIHFAHLLWRWELRRLTGEKCQPSDAELMHRWMDQQPTKAKIRGWASVIRRTGWHRSWGEWPRWSQLGRQASPRYWIYFVAVEIFFGLRRFRGERYGPVQRGDHWELLARKLPLSESNRRTLGPSDWQQLARLIALNYHELLETTST